MNMEVFYVLCPINVTASQGEGETRRARDLLAATMNTHDPLLPQAAANVLQRNWVNEFSVAEAGWQCPVPCTSTPPWTLNLNPTLS